MFLGFVVSEKLNGLFWVTLVSENLWWGDGLHVKQ